ncbi:MAG TPA: double-strand break repair protein AddB, partial [Hyphomicrobiaceae bacterium]|nr:double-strand break repair protein AddB [Hyphomicrobiaceae bacterium]
MTEITTTPHPPAASGSPGLFTVPLGQSFLDRIAKAVLDGALPRPDGVPPGIPGLPTYTILLPTRRAARALQEAFLRAGRGKALLLPQIRPIAEGDEDQDLISGLANPNRHAMSLDIPPKIGELDRRLVLTKLVQRWSEAMRAGTGGEDGGLEPYAGAGARTPAQAVHLASELCQLIDMIETEGMPLDRLAGLVPDVHSEHWQQTLRFLDIIISWWPEHLESSGQLSPADRRNRLIMGEAERLRRAPPDGPVIVAGVTGSIPATTELMKAVAALPNGAIVLPGL